MPNPKQPTSATSAGKTTHGDAGQGASRASAQPGADGAEGPDGGGGGGSAAAVKGHEHAQEQSHGGGSQHHSAGLEVPGATGAPRPAAIPASQPESEGAITVTQAMIAAWVGVGAIERDLLPFDA